MTDERLHSIARATAAALEKPDRKQLRYNEIVEVAKAFYPTNPAAGVIGLVWACDRADPTLYVPKRPMWKVLREEYGWMLPIGVMEDE